MDDIESDADLLRHLGLTEAEAAGFLYRTRQTINQALSRTPRGYLKPNDILALRLAAGHKGVAGIDIEKVARYVAETFDKAAGEQVRTGYGQITSAISPSSYGELWVVLPNASRLAAEWPDHAAFLRALPDAAPDASIVYLFDSDLERRAFAGGLGDLSGEGRSVSLLSENMVGALTTMLIGNPLEAAPEFWVLAQSGFQRAIHVNESLAVLHLQDIVPGMVSLPPTEANRKAGRQRG